MARHEALSIVTGAIVCAAKWTAVCATLQIAQDSRPMLVAAEQNPA
jgi:hypothetical protein